jgi:hypothetical protein
MLIDIILLIITSMPGVELEHEAFVATRILMKNIDGA